MTEVVKCPRRHVVDRAFSSVKGAFYFCRECRELYPANLCKRARLVARAPKPPRPANKDKTHCKNGHEFTPENTYDRPGGGRNCRTCLRDRQAEYKRRRQRSGTEGR